MNEHPVPPIRIVIVGGGTAGWMCAAALAARIDPRRYQVRLIESDAIGTVGVGEATLPQMRDFNTLLGIGEAEFMRATHATFKLGIEFAGWGRGDDRYIHPFGTIGMPIGGADFLACWLRARSEGRREDLLDYCYPVAMAAGDRFAHPPTNGTPSISAAYTYAYHLDATLYAAFLRQWSEARGIKRTEGRIVAVERDATDGDIAALTLDDGSTIDGDFFVDCSGFRALLIGQTLGTPFESWRQWLPCNRALAVPCDRTDPLLPYTRATARTAGWTWRIPLRHRTGNGYVYSAEHISDDAAAAELLAGLDGPAQGDPRPLRFEAGKRTVAWKHNCVALGLAGGFLEPLESTSIYLIQMGIALLLTLLPDESAPADTIADGFNRAMDVEYDRIRDFLILHYHANDRSGSLWRHCREMALPDTLADKIAWFRHRGHVPAHRDGLFGVTSWQAVFVGQNIVPAAHDRIADAIPATKLHETLTMLRAQIVRDAAALPDHAAYIAALPGIAPAGGDGR